MTISEGMMFPPKSDMKRMKRYAINEELFEGEHVKVYKDALQRIERVIGQYDLKVSYPITLNYHRLISTKTADMLLSESPKVISPEGMDVLVNDVLQAQDFWGVVYEAVLDASRYGDGLLMLYRSEDGLRVSVTQPKYWYSIPKPYNCKEVDKHVLAWVIDDNLQVQTHYKGYYVEQIFDASVEGYSESNQFKVGKLLSEQRIDTGLTGFAVVPLSNLTTSGSLYGTDDYQMINDIVSEIMVRLTQISKILDMHATPSMSGSSDLVLTDPTTGGSYFKMANFYPLNSKEDAKPEYITWDGKIDSSFKEIEVLMEQLFILSEMGKTLFDSENAGVTSGTALKFKMLSPMYKAGRLARKFTAPLIYALSELTGIPSSQLSIKFKDGLPNDDKENADIISSRVASGTLSKKTALMIYDEYSEERAVEELNNMTSDANVI